MYRCRICGGTWTEIPPDAVEIAAKRRGTLYQFGGTVHDLRQLSLTFKQHQHLHQKNPKSDCDFCFPPPLIANPEPPVQTELLQEVQPPVQAPAPEIIVEEEPEVAEIETEVEALTALAHAFRRAERRKLS